MTAYTLHDVDGQTVFELELDESKVEFRGEDVYLPFPEANVRQSVSAHGSPRSGALQPWPGGQQVRTALGYPVVDRSTRNRAQAPAGSRT